MILSTRTILRSSAAALVACSKNRTFALTGRGFATTSKRDLNGHPYFYRHIPRNISNFRHDTSRSMTSAYGGNPGDGKQGLDNIDYLPMESTIKNGARVEVAPFQEQDWPTGMELMNLIIREGKTWPFDEEFDTMDAYRAYFLSHAAFVVRAKDDSSGAPQSDLNGIQYNAGEILGCFYIKPNFPGRCSHICNGGFITTPKFRKMGVATIMGKSFMKIARDLGYKSSYFNLVFKSNAASVRLWESLGFERVAVLENAADLFGVEGLDTAYGYRFDLEKLPQDFEI